MSRSISLNSKEANRVAFNIDQKETLTVLEGSFVLEHRPLSCYIRIYISSEITDTIFERNYIIKHVFPLLRSHCQSLGLQFYGVDLYDSIPSLALDPQTLDKESTCVEETAKENGPIHDDRFIYKLEKEGFLKLAHKEIKLSQGMSAGPSFVTLLAQRYGYKPLHSCIVEEDFELIHAAIEEPSTRDLIQQWYLKDTNALPAEYVLQPWDPKIIDLSQWIDICGSLSKTVRKAARVALGKDVSKVQHYVMSAVEEEITHGIFRLKQNPNQCCFWFKRIFTDLLDQRPTDPALTAYADMTIGKRGKEFDSENLKNLNHLKEARLPAKYIGLDSTNIFEFPLKWQKGKGLDPTENQMHEDYLQELCQKMVAVLTAKINATAEIIECEVENKIYQEVVHHALYCKKKAEMFMDRPVVTKRVYDYFSDTSNAPLVVYGEMGSGKTHIMAGIAHRLKERFPLQKMILVVRFIRITPLSFTIRNTLRSICEQLTAVLGEDPFFIPGDFTSLTSHFKTLLHQATPERPIYIFLDGVDQLSPEDGASGMSWLPLHLPPHVKIVLSTSSEMKYRCYPALQSLLAKHLDNLIEVPRLTKEECKALLVHHLTLRRRTLTRDQETAAMMVLLRCPLPLYMDFILVGVLEWRSYTKGIPWGRAPPPNTLHGITEKIFQNMEVKFGKVFFSRVASYITGPQYGLTEMELLDVLSCDQQVMKDINEKWRRRITMKEEEDGSLLTTVPSLLWSQLYQALLPFTELNMGCGGCPVIQWSHRHITEFATSRYLSSEDKIESIFGSLADYFSGKYVQKEQRKSKENESSSDDMAPASSSLMSQPLFLNEKKQLYNVRKLLELPFCLVRCGQKQELQDLLTDYSWLKGRICTSSCAAAVEDFAAILPIVPLQRTQSDSVSFYELRLLRDALSLSVKVLNADPSQLPIQLYGRLMPFIADGETKRPILERIVTHALQDVSSLLTPREPLQNLPGGPLFVSMNGHRDTISSLAATSIKSEETGETGLCILSSSWDKTLKTWDLATTGVLKTFDGHTDKVLSVALTEDGLHAASGSADKTVRHWFVPTAHCLHTMSGHTAAVNAVVMTTNGSKTISGSSDGTIKVWNTNISSSSCGEIIFTLKTHRSPVLCMAFSSDRFLASGARNHIVLITDVISGEVLHSFKDHTEPILSLSIATVDRESYLFIGTQSGRVDIRLVGSGDLVHSLQSSNGSCVNSIVATEDGKVIISHKNKLLSVWQLENGRHLFDLSGHQECVLGMALADQGNLLLTGSQDSSLQIWDLLSYPILQDLQHLNNTTSVSISPCGTYGISGGEDSTLKIYDLNSTKIVQEIETGLKGGISQVLVLRDSERIVVSSLSGSMQLWNGASKELLLNFQGESGPVNCVAISADSELLMSGGEDCKVTFWSMKTGSKLKTFSNHSTPVISVAFCQKYMISASRDGSVCIRDFHTAKVVHNSSTHKSDLLCLAPSPNSAFFVTGSRNKTCHVVDTETGKLRSVLSDHKGPVTCIKVLSNCTQCLTGSEDHFLRLWEVANGDCLAALCVDNPVTTCDVNWKNTLILYGTKRGWVSSILHSSDYEEAKLMLLNKLQAVVSSSDSSRESRSTITTMDDDGEDRKTRNSEGQNT